MKEQGANQLGTLWKGEKEAGKELVTLSYKSAHSCELGDSEQEKESLLQQSRSFTQLQGISHCFSKWGFSCTRESRTGLSSSLQQPSPNSCLASSDVSHGHRKWKIKHKHTAQLGASPRDQQWMMDQVTMSYCKQEKTPRCYPCIPRNQCKNRMCPLLRPSKNLSGAKETSLQKHLWKSWGVFLPKLFEQSFCLSRTSTAAHRSVKDLGMGGGRPACSAAFQSQEHEIC